MGKYTTGDIGLSLFDLLIKILPFGLDRRCSGAADLSSEKTQGSFPVVARALVTVLFVSAGAEATIDPRRRRSRRRRRHHLPSPLSLGISVTSARSTYTNLIDTRPDSSRFDSLLSLSPSLKDEDDIRPSQTGSSTRSFVSRARSNRSIALRSVAEFRSTSPC